MIVSQTFEDSILKPEFMVKGQKLEFRDCILCFFPSLMEYIDSKSRKSAVLFSTLGEHPVYEFEYKDKKLYIFYPGVGCAMAGGFMEELIALGISRFALIGGSGVLRDISVGKIILPRFALCDEGLSRNYFHNEELIYVEKNVYTRTCEYLNNKIDFISNVGTLTTDAIYRETPSKLRTASEKNCVCVEMECSGLLSIAQFRNVELIPILMAGDILTNNKWDFRNWTDSKAEQLKLFNLCCAMMSDWRE